MTKSVCWDIMFTTNGYAEMVEWSIAAVLKTVEARVSGGSNPSLRAKTRAMVMPSPVFFLYRIIERDSRVGAVLWEQNALPYGG